MAKQTNGTLGGFVGKLGPVVGYRWKNVWCVRSQSRIVNNPRTEAQQEHRSLFKQEVQLAGRMRWAVNIGLKELSDQMDMTAQNLFVRANQQCFSLVRRGGVAALKILQKSFLKSFFFGGGKEVHVYAFVQDEGGRCAQNPSKIFFKIFLFRRGQRAGSRLREEPAAPVVQPV